MKRFSVVLLLQVVCVVILLHGCGTVQEMEHQKIKSGDTFAELEERVVNIVSLHYMAAFNIDLKRDRLPEDEYRTAQQTWQLKYGDCEDLAIFCAYFIQRLGKPVYLVNIIAPGYNHVICVWRDPFQVNYYTWSDNGVWKQIYKPKITYIVHKVKPDWNIN